MPGIARGPSVIAILREALLIGVAGVVLAFGANTLSPRGLRLTRNYSPGAALAGSRSLLGTTGTNSRAAFTLLEKQFQAEGLHLTESNTVARLFADPGRDSGLIVFVDARNDEHYLAGHIPGAYQLDHYHPENYLDAVLPACQVAQKIVVYCTGGACEDSEQTAIFLRDSGVPKERLLVYAGGFDEWSANGMPVEVGQRNSGQVRGPSVLPANPAGTAK